MESWSLVKRDDRSFVNPFLSTSPPQNFLQTIDELKKKVYTFATRLLTQWEKDVKNEIDYTANWRDSSVYTGKAGYALLLLEVGKILNSSEYLEQAFFMAEKCTMHLHVHPNDKDLTFLTGAGGPLALSAVCAHFMNQPEKEHHFVHRLQHLYHSSEALLNYQSNLPDELLYGRVGCLYSLLFVKQYCKEKVDDTLIRNIANTIISSGKSFAEQLQQTGCTVPPLMFEWHEQKYLGPAHGMAGIIYLLLQAKDYLQPGVLNNLIRPCLDFLLETRYSSGNFPSSLGSNRDRLVQWCHGAPGFVHCFVAAWKVFDSEVYLTAARLCADVSWERGVLTKGYSICHGIAGNALAILHLYQHTKEPIYLYRSYKLAEIVMDNRPHEFRTPDRPLSLFEGTAGVIYFLLSLLEPEKSMFPGYQIDFLK